VDGGEHFQRPLRGSTRRHFRGAVAHDRFMAVLLPPVADVEKLADFSDHELARRGAAGSTQFDDEQIAILDALVVHLVAAGAENHFPFFQDRGRRYAVSPDSSTTASPCRISPAMGTPF